MKANSTSEIWSWIKTDYIPANWPKRNAAEKLRAAYDQRYLFDHCSYRLGLTRIRQVRTAGKQIIYFGTTVTLHTVYREFLRREILAKTKFERCVKEGVASHEVLKPNMLQKNCAITLFVELS